MKKEIKWMLSELPKLVSGKIINQKSADDIENYYLASEEKNKNSIFIVFAIIGAVLTGLGIILIFAYNWNNFPRYVKVIRSLVPLVCAQILSWYVLNKKIDSDSWREGMGTFWPLAFAASFALISQTYHLAGNIENYYLIVAIFTLPILYILQSSVSYILYLAFITAWAAYSQLNDGIGGGFWIMFALAAPFMIAKLKENIYSFVSLRLAAITMLALTIGIGISLEKCLPGIWMVIYMSFFVAMYLLGGIIYEKGNNALQRPLFTFGLIGTAFLSWLLTFSWFWENIGWKHYRDEGKFHSWASITDYVLVILLPAAAMGLLYYCNKKKKEALLDFGVAPLITILSYLAVAYNDNSYPTIQFVFNLYVLYLGVRAIIMGFKTKDLAVTNAGMLLFSMLLIARFFDMEMSFLERGICFVVLGAGFITANLVMMNKRGAEK